MKRKSDVELLQILLDNIKHIGTDISLHNHCHGLCRLISYLTIRKHLFKYHEYYRITSLISENRHRSKYGPYYFKPGDRESRIKYLKKLIKKYETV